MGIGIPLKEVMLDKINVNLHAVDPRFTIKGHKDATSCY